MVICEYNDQKPRKFLVRIYRAHITRNYCSWIKKKRVGPHTIKQRIWLLLLHVFPLLEVLFPSNVGNNIYNQITLDICPNFAYLVTWNSIFPYGSNPTRFFLHVTSFPFLSFFFGRWIIQVSPLHNFLIMTLLASLSHMHVYAKCTSSVSTLF